MSSPDTSDNDGQGESNGPKKVSSYKNIHQTDFGDDQIEFLDHMADKFQLLLLTRNPYPNVFTTEDFLAQAEDYACSMLGTTVEALKLNRIHARMFVRRRLDGI